MKEKKPKIKEKRKRYYMVDPILLVASIIYIFPCVALVIYSFVTLDKYNASVCVLAISLLISSIILFIIAINDYILVDYRRRLVYLRHGNYTPLKFDDLAKVFTAKGSAGAFIVFRVKGYNLYNIRYISIFEKRQLKAIDDLASLFDVTLVPPKKIKPKSIKEESKNPYLFPF